MASAIRRDPSFPVSSLRRSSVSFFVYNTNIQGRVKLPLASFQTVGRGSQFVRHPILFSTSHHAHIANFSLPVSPSLYPRTFHLQLGIEYPSSDCTSTSRRRHSREASQCMVGCGLYLSDTKGYTAKLHRRSSKQAANVDTSHRRRNLPPLLCLLTGAHCCGVQTHCLRRLFSMLNLIGVCVIPSWR